jgi:GR25 family glycosyltransferase involved in LPS biosynthesis
MVNINNSVKLNQIEYSYATRLPTASGEQRWRVSLSEADHALKVAAITSLVFFYYLYELFWAFFGYERHWVKLSVVDENTLDKSEILININSLCYRTVLKREEVLSKSPDELSEILSQPDQVAPRCQLNALFPHAILINLDARTDRVESLIQHLNTIGQRDFQYTRQSAVVGKLLPLEEINRMCTTNAAINRGKDDRPGRMGVFLSQLQALKYAKEKGYPYVLMLEDDIRVMPEYLASGAFEKAMRELPEDWGILYWGCYDSDPEKAESYSDHLKIPGRPLDTHAWMINSSVYDLMIQVREEELRKENGQMRPNDVTMAEEMKKHCRVFATKENMIIQEEGFSNILDRTVYGNNYYRQARNLEDRYGDPQVKEKTADGIAVMDPLQAGTLYQMMTQLDKLLANHGVSYWVNGTSCLGAERHRGLIPWEDHLSLCLAPGDQEKLKSEKLKIELAALGLRIEEDVLGFNLFSEKEHTFVTPRIDLFITQEDQVEGERVISHGGLYYKQSEVFDAQGKIRRVQFGPIQLNGLWKGVDFCKRNFGSSCMLEAIMQDGKPVRLTDYRTPAYMLWDGLPQL